MEEVEEKAEEEGMRRRRKEEQEEEEMVETAIILRHRIFPSRKRNGVKRKIRLFCLNVNF